MSETAKYISFDQLEEALNICDLFINPDFLEYAANEIDCCPGSQNDCEYAWHEFDTNASGCRKEENGQYCPFALAETLRALAKTARLSPNIAPFIVTFDGGKTEFVTLADVLQWRDWSEREKLIIRDVESGKARRFSTSKNGRYCDIELRSAAALRLAEGDGE
jgi:hypothetical protein